MLIGEINGDGDSTDEEFDDTKEESDEEQDKPIFESDNESFEEDSDEDSENEEEEESEEETSGDEESAEEDSLLESESDGNEDKNEIIINKIQTDSKKALNKNKNKENNKNSPKVKSEENKMTTKPETEIKTSSSTVNEYESGDTSDEEDIRNTIGNVPLRWYNDTDHVGYDWEGKKIIKPEKGDQLDNFLKRMEDPDFWRTVKDYQTGQNVILSEADIQLITRIQKQRIPDAQFDEYAVSKINSFLNTYLFIQC